MVRERARDGFSGYLMLVVTLVYPAIPISLFFTGCAVGFLFMSTVNYHTWTLITKWWQFSLFIFFMLLLLVSYFLLLGLLSELAVTASGMHRRRVQDRLMIRSH